jgi:hypothetical protein
MLGLCEQVVKRLKLVRRLQRRKMLGHSPFLASAAFANNPLLARNGDKSRPRRPRYRFLNKNNFDVRLDAPLTNMRIIGKEMSKTQV